MKPSQFLVIRTESHQLYHPLCLWLSLVGFPLLLSTLAGLSGHSSQGDWGCPFPFGFLHRVPCSVDQAGLKPTDPQPQPLEWLKPVSHHCLEVEVAFKMQFIFSLSPSPSPPNPIGHHVLTNKKPKFHWNCWPVRSHRPYQTLQAIAIALV